MSGAASDASGSGSGEASGDVLAPGVARKLSCSSAAIGRAVRARARRGEVGVFFALAGETRPATVPRVADAAALRRAMQAGPAAPAAPGGVLHVRDRESGVERVLEDGEELYDGAVITPRHAAHVEALARREAASQRTWLSNKESYARQLLGRSSLVLCTVGRPAAGKSQAARKLARYLTWIGVPACVFAVADVRQQRHGFLPAEHYDPVDTEAVAARLADALATLRDALAYLDEAPGRAAVFDANNVTAARRQALVDELQAAGVPLANVLFVEFERGSAAEEADRRGSVSIAEADHFYTTQMDAEAAAGDLQRRLAFYDHAYEPLPIEWAPRAGVAEPGMVRVCAAEARIAMRGVYSHVWQRIVNLLINLRTRKKKVWFSRHGESLYNLSGRLGGNSDLSDKGHAYARVLAGWFDANLPPDERKRLVVWTSTLQRTLSTARHFECDKIALPMLDEIDAGVCDGMTYDGIARDMPTEFAARKADKYRYRYPQGESYVDLVARLESVLLELERIDRPVLVISHQAITRVLLSFYKSIEVEKIPYLSVPLHTLIQMEPNNFKIEWTEFPLMDGGGH